MKLTKVFAAAMAAFALASCNSDSENITTQQVGGFINTSFDNYGEMVGTCSGVAYTLQLNYDTQKTRLAIDGLKLASGQQFTTLVFEDVPFTQTNLGAVEIKARNLRPSTSLMPVSFDEFNITILPRFVQNQYLPCTKINYVVNGENVVSLCKVLACQGTTTVKTENADPFVTTPENGTMYILDCDPATKRANLNISGATFAANMPGMNMRFKDIPYTITSDGYYVLEIDELVPVIVGSNGSEEKYENFPITELTCKADCFNNMDLKFVCTTHIQPSGMPMPIVTRYEVTVDCKAPTFKQ